MVTKADIWAPLDTSVSSSEEGHTLAHIDANKNDLHLLNTLYVKRCKKDSLTKKNVLIRYYRQIA